MRARFGRRRIEERQWAVLGLTVFGDGDSLHTEHHQMPIAAASRRSLLKIGLVLAFLPDLQSADHQILFGHQLFRELLVGRHWAILLHHLESYELSSLSPDMTKLVLTAALLCTLAGSAAARNLPDGFQVVPSSLSLDGKLGVIAPDLDHAKDREHQNKLIEIATGKVLAVIDADTAFEHQNHTTLSPKWSEDSSLLVWYVDGKWGSYALVLLRIDHGAVTAQINARELAVQEALRAARQANPKACASAKLEGKDSGSWFRDGFAIEVRPEASETAKIALPLKLVIEMTSNPKAMDSYPKAARFSGKLTGVVGADGKLTFSKLVVTTR